MKHYILTAVLFFNSISYAATTFNVESFQSPEVNSIVKVTLVPLATGELGVTIDPNFCAPHGGTFTCTNIAIRYYEVDPKVISDLRPAGPLTLDLTNDLQLVVTPPIKTSITSYTAVFGSGTPSEERLALTPQVNIVVK